jgi:hypothetical protein
MFHCLIMCPFARIHPGMVPSKLQFKVIAADYYIDDMHACCFVVYSISSGTLAEFSSHMVRRTCPSRVASHLQVHTFIELHKFLHHDKSVIREGVYKYTCLLISVLFVLSLLPEWDHLYNVKYKR